MAHLIDMNAARQEAFEEAGIAGRMKRKAIGIYEYEKSTLDGSIAKYSVKVFQMEVQRELRTWPEDHERVREWFRVEMAAEKVDEPGLKKIIRGWYKMKMGH